MKLPLYFLLDSKSLEQLTNREHTRTYKLQKEDFKICLIRSIEEQARPIESRICKILIKPKQQFKPIKNQGFRFTSNSSSSPLRIWVSDLFLPVYKRNSKHVFMRLFKERRVCLFCIQGFVPKKLSHIFYRCYYLKNLKIQYCRSCCIL